MLSKTAEYALRATVWLAQAPGEPASADQLSEVTKVPRRYLHKVLQDLVRGKLLRSHPGPGGGYALLRSPEQITILDVVNAVAPLERITKCPLGLTSHTRLCPLHKQLDQAYAATEAALKAVTLEELRRSKSAIVPLCESLG
ncbi:MAG: Rrf2 family transcriptional regulator [Planctomycetota bacterium]|nr:Rrf2 family transcriptional regulator [Planctomycetota bacterium]